MAKDDYFVIAYRIMAYLYACLKAGEQPNFNIIRADALDISKNYWEYIIRHLYEDGYVEGISLIHTVGRSAAGIKLNADFMITPKGIDFLLSNSAMSRAKDFLKTLKETIPGL